ncbi:MAG: hypothetical protein OXH75_21660 [Acidobacteria bacterium]|nr:hypothetical protein [Acidobacteriota bacterium]
MDDTASLYSINRLTAYLQSLGHRAPKPTVSDYVAWFEDAFFLFTVPVFDASLARAKTNPKKIYCVDHALVRSIGSGILVNSGHLTALAQAMAELGTRTGTVVTGDEEETIAVDAGSIEVLPAWRFLLDVG